jgi:hypothetical protein
MQKTESHSFGTVEASDSHSIDNYEAIAAMPTFRKYLVLLTIVSIGMIAAHARASMVLAQNLEGLESQAQLIFVGVCTSRTTYLDAGGLPVNMFTFDIIEPVKGDLRKGSRIKVRHFGNGVPDARGRATVIAGLPTYAVGREVLLFLNPPGRIGLTTPVGLSQGLFSVVRDADGTRQIVLSRERRRLLLDGIDRATYSETGRLSATGRRLLRDLPARIDCDAFCSLVRNMARTRTELEGGAR